VCCNIAGPWLVTNLSYIVDLGATSTVYACRDIIVVKFCARGSDKDAEYVSEVDVTSKTRHGNSATGASRVSDPVSYTDSMS
jgi:hypothetical protein